MAISRPIRLSQFPSRLLDRLRWEWREWHTPSRPSFQHEELDDALLNRIPWHPGERVLDVGCGNGVYMQELTDRQVNIQGLDLSIPSLLQARRHGRPVVAASGEQLPIRSASFDTILCHKTMYVFASPDAALAEFSRVLRPGGRLVFSTSATRTPYALAQRAATRWLHQSNWRGGNHLGPMQWARRARQHGFHDARFYSCNLVVPIVFRVCDRWIVPNEWMRRYARFVRRLTNCPVEGARPRRAAQDYVMVLTKSVAGQPIR